ncbi:sensor histidine kinase [Demequina sp.]|uniref:sensor histidine kinase n=1 Tax=Demequina sp. TaxID=2050685 RepID=UPI003D11F56B
MMSRESSARMGVPIRVRVVLTLVLLTAAALVVAGITAAALQAVQVTNSIDDDLLSSAAEFERLAAEGTNPDTGKAFSTPEELLRASMERVVTQGNEGLLGFVDGKLSFRSRDAAVALDSDKQLLEALEPLTTHAESTLTDITTDTTTYRVLVIPVSVAGSAGTTATAAQVVGYDKSAELEGFQRVFRTYIFVAVAAVALIAAFGWLIGGRILGPVRTLADAADRIGDAGSSERIPEQGRDELTQMTRSVNSMLDRLDDSAAAQRALLDDVSHELRTPVTVIRGHLEVMGPEDVEETRAIALDELDRMSRLIDDLLTLAVTDQPDFVRLDPCDVGPLTDDVAEKARALGDREWRVAERTDAQVLGDAQRLTQAWLQLAANAVKFSSAGSIVTLGSRATADAVVLWVADQGVGIAKEEQDRIFDRFERSGQRLEGAGLGLPIVSAIAAAHHGTVTVDSSPGEGATFEISLPRWAAEQEPEQ